MVSTKYAACCCRDRKVLKKFELENVIVERPLLTVTVEQTNKFDSQAFIGYLLTYLLTICTQNGRHFHGHKPAV